MSKRPPPYPVKAGLRYVGNVNRRIRVQVGPRHRMQDSIGKINKVKRAGAVV
jgi:hypothetical protein